MNIHNHFSDYTVQPCIRCIRVQIEERLSQIIFSWYKDQLPHYWLGLFWQTLISLLFSLFQKLIFNVATLFQNYTLDSVLVGFESKFVIITLARSHQLLLSKYFSESEIACVTGISAQFQSKAQGMRIKDWTKNKASEIAGGGGEKDFLSFFLSPHPLFVWFLFHFSRGQNRNSSLVFHSRGGGDCWEFFNTFIHSRRSLI